MMRQIKITLKHEMRVVLVVDEGTEIEKIVSDFEDAICDSGYNIAVVETTDYEVMDNEKNSIKR